MGMPVIVPGSITKEIAVGAIIESIAMEEAALSHILNAESEKMMAVISRADATSCDLLAINKSVEETIRAIIQLELMLQAKLRLVQGTICQTEDCKAPDSAQ